MLRSSPWLSKAPCPHSFLSSPAQGPKKSLGRIEGRDPSRRDTGVRPRMSVFRPIGRIQVACCMPVFSPLTASQRSVGRTHWARPNGPIESSPLGPGTLGSVLWAGRPSRMGWAHRCGIPTRHVARAEKQSSDTQQAFRLPNLPGPGAWLDEPSRLRGPAKWAQPIGPKIGLGPGACDWPRRPGSQQNLRR